MSASRRTLVNSFAAILVLSGSLAGCTLYKSADREKFNENPLAGAPTPQPSLVALSESCANDRDLSAQLNDSILGAELRSNGKIGYFVKSTSTEFESTTRYTVFRLHAPANNSTLGVECTFEFPAGSLSSEIERVSHQLVESFID